MDLYRAEATRKHRGRASKWKGKWRPEMRRAVEQAKRWRTREAFAHIEIVSTSGMRATLDEVLSAPSLRNFR